MYMYVAIVSDHFDIVCCVVCPLNCMCTESNEVWPDLSVQDLPVTESTDGAIPQWYKPTMHVRQIGHGLFVVNRCGYVSLSTSYIAL